MLFSSCDEIPVHEHAQLFTGSFGIVTPAWVGNKSRQIIAIDISTSNLVLFVLSELACQLSLELSRGVLNHFVNPDLDHEKLKKGIFHQ